jgi:hypothetical protein
MRPACPHGFGIRGVREGTADDRAPTSPDGLRRACSRPYRFQFLSSYSGVDGGLTCVRLALVPSGTIDISPVIYGRVSGSPHPFASRQGRLNESRGEFQASLPGRGEEGGRACFTRRSKHRATIKRPTGRSYGDCLPVVSYSIFRRRRWRNLCETKVRDGVSAQCRCDNQTDF